MSIIDGARVRWREWRENVAERKRLKQTNLPPHAAPLAWCLFITAVGVFALAGSTWMLVVFIAGSVGHIDWFSDYVATQEGVDRWEWNFTASIHWFMAIGLWLLCLAIGIFNAVWIELRQHFHGTFKTLVTVLGLATATLMVSGGVVVQQRGADARSRDEVITAQTAQAGVAAIDAEIESLERRWQTLCATGLTTWQAQACRSGEQAWNDRINIAREQYRPNDPQLQIIVRAIADAREGDRMQARLMELRRERAAASVETVEATAITVRAEGWMAGVTTFIEDIRKPFTSILGELLAMSAFPMALAAWATRRKRRDVEGSGWAPEELRIEDMRQEAAVTPQPMKPPREVVTDAETGEELVKVKPREYWRKRKGQKQKLAIEPEIPPDEKGVSQDGGSRIAMTAAGPMEMPASAAASNSVEQNEQQADEQGEPEAPVVEQPSDQIQDTPPELSDDELVAIRAELAVVADEQPVNDSDHGGETDEASDSQKQPDVQNEMVDSEAERNAEGNQQHTEQDAEEQIDRTDDHRSTPETDPKRMIGVAAE